jgi:3',5'-nucleoside bisphosphate phosphatase
MTKADLHIHSTASDGALSPTQVVERAAKAGLSAIALTDHDSVSGIEEATDAGERLGVRVVPGIEINTDFGPADVHILGYFVDRKSEKLLKLLGSLREARVERGRRMVEKLQALGVNVTFDRVMEIAGTGSVGRVHVALAVVECGVVASVNSAFGRFLVKSAPAYVERTKMTPHDAIAAIADTGGVACLAHPGKVKWDDLIPGMIKVGLGALEVWHPDHSAQESRRYQALARKYKLIATGGSDAHCHDRDSGSDIGTVTVDTGVVEELRAAAPAGSIGRRMDE